MNVNNTQQNLGSSDGDDIITLDDTILSKDIYGPDGVLVNDEDEDGQDEDGQDEDGNG